MFFVVVVDFVAIGWWKGTWYDKTKISGDSRCTCQSWPDWVMRRVLQEVNKAIKQLCVKLLGRRRFVKLQWPNENSLHMARKCKYPAFARMSWSSGSNRLWKGGAKCSGIMLELWDKTDSFYYKSTGMPCLKQKRKEKNVAHFVLYTKYKWSHSGCSFYHSLWFCFLKSTCMACLAA